MSAFVLIAGFALTFGIRAPFVGVIRHVGQIFMFAALGAYFIYQWRDGHRTLAMKTWGLSIVDRVGLPISTRAAVVRYVAAWIGPLLAALSYPVLGKLSFALAAINFLWALVSPSRQFLHDDIARSKLLLDPGR